MRKDEIDHNGAYLCDYEYSDHLFHQSNQCFNALKCQKIVKKFENYGVPPPPCLAADDLTADRRFCRHLSSFESIKMTADLIIGHFNVRIKKNERPADVLSSLCGGFGCLLVFVFGERQRCFKQHIRLVLNKITVLTVVFGSLPSFLARPLTSSSPSLPCLTSRLAIDFRRATFLASDLVKTADLVRTADLVADLVITANLINNLSQICLSARHKSAQFRRSLLVAMTNACQPSPNALQSPQSGQTF